MSRPGGPPARPTYHRRVSTPHLVHADEIVVGTSHDLGEHLVTAEELLEFAGRWDPQGFHVDEELAAAGAFGGVIASGIHSLAIVQRLAVVAVYSRWAVVAARSFTDVRFSRPVRPGTTLTGRLHVEAVEPRGPERSLVHENVSLWEGEVCVLSYRAEVYVARRSGATGP